MEICEIFYSLQGESSYMGMPCVFIRLSGCNLRCSYCDTKYSYQSGTSMDIASILKEVGRYPARLVELTGGEPLWQDDSNLLMQRLLEQGYTVLLETNGSLCLEEVPKAVVRIVDVKCPGSGHANSFMLWNLKLLQPQDELKFVLTNYIDYAFARDFVRAHELSGRTIHFSPVTRLLAPELLAEWLLEDGLRVRLSLQLHKLLNLR
ncbi:MAG: radical SAM protein [Candidatus Cloacimonetes bacterium]|nr:radical SAM protein [Candidatus Cloacimonadota bacterium]MCB5255798.1 radical SAM protein [Candidatus Cloacimonadota bacterium]MCK9178319.1 radical SAM protein [Candidatus Cloacimonadota bacterium]MCK9243032.1 radical SAM protein [Candidatus Cloacimonadota bacterium]MDD3103549.1 radical SAM protein [Candidatus Cloacimonadota bacterium]